ncbi:zinc finger BED domain-containing protein 4-like [Drosophila sechellia]|uniref:zinc finger BED domain-containing protein 4-like n=1 Tax=Drosophila sechellia TaxID=7238 RepID=UPI0013DDDA88|nr:zinc finger BED domain-containing protein 4-like [Drosophila sechellia]XP_032577031.1 zinc finger BED domain-containing protein 4-like [Drosophila sechellia]
MRRISLHFINECYGLKSAVLSTHKLVDATNHCASNIANSLSAVLNECNLFNKVVTIVTDNDASMKEKCELMKMKHLPCVSHTFNLLVQDLLKIDSIVPLLAKCKRIVSLFKSSSIATKKLKNAQTSKSRYGLIQEVPTRWNSAYYMIQRIILVNDSLSALLLNSTKDPRPLSADEMFVLVEICQVLAQFHEATVQISTNKTLSISVIIPLIYELHQKSCKVYSQVISHPALDICEAVKKRLPERFSHYETRTVTRIATLLDPRFKKDGFLFTSNSEKAAKALQLELFSSLSRVLSTPDISTPPNTPQEKRNSFFTFLETKISNKVHSNIRMLLRTYFEGPNEPEDKDPLAYWMANSESLKPITKLF